MDKKYLTGLGFVALGMTALTIAGSSVGMGGDTAFAYSPAPHSQRQTNDVETAAATTGHVSDSKTSTGVHIYNNSVYTMTLQSVSGDNCGVPPIGSVLQSGIGYQNLEVTFRAAKTTTVTAVYALTDPSSGEQVGTATIKASVDAFYDVSVSSTFTPMNGADLQLKTGSYSTGYQVESSVPTTVDASSPVAARLANEYCNTTTTDAKCTFKPTSEDVTTQEALLAESYTDSNSTAPGSVSVADGYSASTSDSWSVTASATAELAGVFQAGISATYGKTITLTHVYNASTSISVPVGDTGYLWGAVPITSYSGTMQISLGGSTYVIDNATVSAPDPTRTLSQFQGVALAGKDPLNSPNTPPADAAALPALERS
jgi:hypothetical protein